MVMQRNASSSSSSIGANTSSPSFGAFQPFCLGFNTGLNSSFGQPQPIEVPQPRSTLVLEFSFRLRDLQNKTINSYKGYLDLGWRSPFITDAEKIKKWTAVLTELCGPCEVRGLIVSDAELTERTEARNNGTYTFRNDNASKLFKVSMCEAMVKFDMYVICATEQYAKSTALKWYGTIQTGSPQRILCSEYKMIGVTPKSFGGENERNPILDWMITKRYLKPAHIESYSCVFATDLAKDYCICYHSEKIAEDRDDEEKPQKRRRSDLGETGKRTRQ